MTPAEMKAAVGQTIDAHGSELEALARQIFAQPELGFKEHRTASVVQEWFDRLGLDHRDGIALTGTRADLACGSAGPTVAILGELDSLLCWEHPDRDPRTGAVHACGHNAQIAMMLGAGLALREVAPHLAGRIALMAVPAEEYVELEERLAFREQGQLEFLGGKAEMVRLGAFDDVDVAMMVHASSRPEDGDIAVGGTNNGMVAKFVRFLGRTSHAGGAPDQGINALSAARVALAGIDAIRETFRDDDHIRVHPIVTRGGDVVNAIPADVRIELFCRGASVEAIELAHRKVDRALKAGALAVGGSVEITTLPGYLPLFHDPTLVAMFRANAVSVVGADNVRDKGHGGGSTDMGDISHILPTVHPYAGGAAGAGHGADYRIEDYTRAVLNPARALAMTVVDLLSDNAREAKRVKAEFKPRMTRDDYLAYLRRLSTRQLYRAEDLE
ncbi:MAG TPA: amidohydrolase [Chloroflexota bacterium]|nr:amidohydrolase [Chloroflexota bacterium]